MTTPWNGHPLTAERDALEDVARDGVQDAERVVVLASQV